MKPKKKEWKEKIDFKHNLKVYWSLVKKYKLLVITLLIATLIKETLRLSDKFLFKIVIDKATEYIAEIITLNALTESLVIVLMVFIGILIFRVIVRWLFIHFVNQLDSKLMFDLKKKFFDHILNLSHKFHISNKTGSLISRTIRGSGAVERMTDVIAFNFVPVIFQLIIVIISLIYLDFMSAVIITLIMLAFIGYSYIIVNKQQITNLVMNNNEDVEKANISDIFTNIDSIKLFGKEKLIEKRHKKLATSTKHSQIRHWNLGRWMDGGQGVIIDIGTIFLLAFPILRFISGDMTIGTLAFIYTAFLALRSQSYGLIYGIRGYYRSMADFQALFQYGKISNDIKDKPFAKTLNIKKPTIVFDNVSFSYDNKKILSNFSLDIPANKKVAFVGASGAGKSTIVKLLYRLYDVNKGSIIIDGKNIKDVKQESLRSELSVVPQECVLFDDTIYNNIRFSNPNATRKQVMKAIKFAQLDKIIKEFPNKEQTIVGERGVKLSGGEKQRVSIARAILANKKILVLDEATSSLDSETEHEIQRDLAKLMQGRTSIIIAHRLSTIMSADIIVVIDKGRIKQIGTHDDLIQHKGIYNKLWKIQKGGYIE